MSKTNDDGNNNNKENDVFTDYITKKHKNNST